MPLYEYKCDVCEKEYTAVRKISDRARGPLCCSCPSRHVILTAPSFKAVNWNVNYYCNGLGKPITSMRQRKYEMDKVGGIDAREFDRPELKPREEYNAPEVPAELREAMVREGKGDLLESQDSA